MLEEYRSRAHQRFNRLNHWKTKDGDKDKNDDYLFSTDFASSGVICSPNVIVLVPPAGCKKGQKHLYKNQEA